MSLTLAFVMDPIERVNVTTDTSFAFMLAAQARGHRIVHVNPQDIGLEQDQTVMRGRRLRVEPKQGGHFEVLESFRLAARDTAAVFIRTDPPFDDAYLTVTWLLSFAEAQGTRIINSARGIRSANEHLYALEAKELCPKTVVSNSRAEILGFVKSVGGDAIAKPIDGHAGFGVVRLRLDDGNCNALIDLLTHEGRRPIVVQAFIPSVKEGDKRLILIDGEIRGAIRRVPQGNDHRGNVHIGGRAESCQVEASDRRIAERLKPMLRRDGLFFVGLDVIGDWLIEVNVTSPTLVQEIKRFGGPDLATEVIEAVERASA